ncbi:MAG: hypothetical protein RJB08_274 [Actinomycetota bacterium]|jgi:DNA-binding CsgD family transcriptional regulator
MKCCVARSAGDGLSALVDELHQRATLEISEIDATGSNFVPVLKSGSVDVLVFHFGVSDLVRTVRMSAELDATRMPRLVVASDPLSGPVKALAVLSGFHGAIQTVTNPAGAVDSIHDIHLGRIKIDDDPEIRRLNLTTGLLVRTLIVDDELDEQVLNLLGLGLSDDEIVVVTGIGIQAVRNRIARLLKKNDLVYRTQLAVARAASLKVPDFS